VFGDGNMDPLTPTITVTVWSDRLVLGGAVTKAVTYLPPQSYLNSKEVGRGRVQQGLLQFQFASNIQN
jgi:hypothetical protein